MAIEADRQRTDARANRDRILNVAREALAADPEASLHSIAKAAGVGQGTLYRHFTSRESLVLGVYQQSVDALVALAPALLAEHPPLVALRIWCHRFVQYGRSKQGLAGVVRSAMSEKDLQATYHSVVDAVRQLINACIQSGGITPNTDAEDITQLLGCMFQLPSSPEGKARTERLLALVFRGLGVADTPS